MNRPILMGIHMRKPDDWDGICYEKTKKELNKNLKKSLLITSMGPLINYHVACKVYLIVCLHNLRLLQTKYSTFNVHQLCLHRISTCPVCHFSFYLHPVAVNIFLGHPWNVTTRIDRGFSTMCEPGQCYLNINSFLSQTFVNSISISYFQQWIFGYAGV